MDHTIWRNRLNNRNDMAARITHLTRGNDAEDAFKNLWKILVDKKLNGSGNSGFINGYEEILSDKIRYSPFGVRFHKMFIYNKGGRPVIYENKEIMKKLLPENEYWRIVDLDLTDSKSFVDWTHEREWRVPGELSFSYNNIEVIVKDSSYYRKLVEQCIKTKRTDILVNIRGIITLDSVYS